MKRSRRYRDSLAERLRAVLHERGHSVASVEKRLEHGRNYVSDALRGQKKLSVEVILEVLDAINVRPEQFFDAAADISPGHRETAEGEPERGGAARGNAAPDRGAPPLVEAVVRFLAKKELLSDDELHDMRRELTRVVDRERAVAPRPARARRR